MRYHHQNLNEKNGQPFGAMIWSGRAWLYLSQRREIHWEWHFGKHAGAGFRVGMDFGHGGCDDGILLYAGIPFLFSLYFGVDGVKRFKKPFEVGVSIHDNAIYLKTFSWSDEWSSGDPWYRKGLSWSFPWDYRHHMTEILGHWSKEPALVEVSGGKDRGKHFLDGFEKRQEMERRVSVDYPYAYTRKNGEVQNRIATVHIDRMTWRMRWWPLLPFKKVRTSINVKFNEEVGEGTGSWKCGCTGCGYEMLPGESAEQTLRRMERDRKFNR